ncbi:MAG: hypothetical protein M3032_00680 [Verrucomicrobiota bacterium]|nr:hypothetical protein [Verrucomicrobiota bacterium]
MTSRSLSLVAAANAALLAVGFVFSAEAALGPNRDPRLQVLSARAQVRSGDDVLIGGLTIGGSTPKTVLFRAIGASLALNGTPLPGRLPDPTLALYAQSSGVLIAANDNWADTQQSAIAATGMAPTNGLDSAILVTLAPGSYTTVLSGKTGAAGIALVEAYDVTQNTDTSLGTLSARGFVQPGDNVLIGGFKIAQRSSANESYSVLVRAIGPSLARYNIARPLLDPTLQVYDANGTLLASNDDWRDGPFPEIERGGFAPADDREAVVLGAFAPGAYTAIVRGKGDATGTALVEIYDATVLNPPTGQ